jgi:hypothetical protein
MVLTELVKFEEVVVVVSGQASDRRYSQPPRPFASLTLHSPIVTVLMAAVTDSTYISGTCQPPSSFFFFFAFFRFRTAGAKLQSPEQLGLFQAVCL